MGQLVQDGFNKWKAFHDKYSSEQKKIQALMDWLHGKMFTGFSAIHWGSASRWVLRAEILMRKVTAFEASPCQVPGRLSGPLLEEISQPSAGRDRPCAG